MLGADVLTACEVGYGAGYFEDAVVSAGAEIEALHGGLQQLLAYIADDADALEQVAAHLRIAVNAGLVLKAGGLYVAGFHYTFAHSAAVLSAAGRGKFAEGYRGHFYVEVY